MTLPVLFATLVMLWIATPAWAGYAEGKAAFDEGDYDTAFKEFQPLASRENINAQYYLGVLYRYGWGVLQNYTEAARWLRFAAYQGHVRAQFDMGTMYNYGQGVTKDLVEAKRWYRLAARQGDADAQHNLNILYYENTKRPVSPRADTGGFPMNANPGDWFASMLSSMNGGGSTMTIGGILAITILVLLIAIPIVMPFSIYRIKPLINELAGNAAQRDRELIEEIQKITPLLQRIAESSEKRDDAILHEMRKLTAPLDEDDDEA